MFERFRLRKSALPPTWQPALGRSDDRADFTPPEPSLFERLLGFGSDGRIYEMDVADQKRLRPILLPDRRAERNRAYAAERARTRSRGEPPPSPVSFANDGPPAAPGVAPDAYSPDAFTASQPDMDATTRAWIGGYRAPEFGPRHKEARTVEPISATAAAEIEATASGLVSSKWIVVPPRSVG